MARPRFEARLRRRREPFRWLAPIIIWLCCLELPGVTRHGARSISTLFVASAQAEDDKKLRRPNASPNATPVHVRRGEQRQRRSGSLKADSDVSESDTTGKKGAEFLNWCHKALGITTTSVAIQTFEYYDHVQAMAKGTGEFCDEDEDDDAFLYLDPGQRQDYRPPCSISETEYPKIKVRGLAATKPISSGETILRIPYQALWTIGNVIDRDPALSQVLGPKARQEFGWEDDLNYYELPLLAVALLHHVQLGTHSQFWPYWEMLEDEHLDIPFLWSPQRLKLEGSNGVRRIARGIQRDIREMYIYVVHVLIDAYPDVFGPLTPSSDDALEAAEIHNNGDDEDEDELLDEWMFSFERFEWAFALVNSRHWHLAIPPSQEAAAKRAEQKIEADRNGHVKEEEEAIMPDIIEEEDQGNMLDSPPASVPTDEWLSQQEHQVKEETVDEKDTTDQDQNLGGNIGSSFLAPFADFINFGPPCTRGVYNIEEQSFDIVATCSFAVGQEITFWYSNACQDIIMANYGFTYPTMIPKCPSLGEWKQLAHLLATKNRELDGELHDLFEDLDRMAIHLESVEAILDKCDCCKQEGGEQEPRTAPPSSIAARRQPPSITTPTNMLVNDDNHKGIQDGNSQKSSLQRGVTTGSFRDDDRSAL